MNMRVAVVLALVVLALVPAVVGDTYTQQLRIGFNLWAPPLDNIQVDYGNGPSPAYDAQDWLFTMEYGVEGACRLFYSWTGVDYWIYQYSSGYNTPPADYHKGYWLLCDQNMDVTIEGTPFPTTNTLELTQGFNLINIPISYDTGNPPTASDVAAWVAPVCTRQSILYRYSSSGYELYITNKPPRATEPMSFGTNFNIAPGEGYWLYCSGSGTVTLGPAN